MFTGLLMHKMIIHRYTWKRRERGEGRAEKMDWLLTSGGWEIEDEWICWMGRRRWGKVLVSERMDRKEARLTLNWISSIRAFLSMFFQLWYTNLITSYDAFFLNTFLLILPVPIFWTCSDLSALPSALELNRAPHDLWCLALSLFPLIN